MVDRVLVTGISGFIAKRVTLALLARSCEVRGTLRSAGRAEEVRAAIAAAGGDADRLSFVVADLESDDGWAEAVAGCRFVQHIASPFPLAPPRDREALVPAAREGALRVLEAALAAGVERIVMTSSMVAMMYRPGRPAVVRVAEGDWTDPEWRATSAYVVSKTRAERAAWELVDGRGARSRLVVVNPGFVLGPLLDRDSGTSIDVVKMMMTGAYPALIPVGYPVVDVRDLADLQVAAMTADVAGRRLMAAAGAMSMHDMARTLRNAFPERARKIPTRTLPGFAVRLLSVVDRSLRSVIADLGTRSEPDSAYVTALTGIRFRPVEEAVRAAAQSLVDFGLV